MRTSEEGLRLIRESEGLRLKAYQDTGGVWTIGYGHTGSDVKPGMVLTRAEAEALLKFDVAEAEDVVARHVPDEILAALPQKAYDALVDTAFNLGDQMFRNPRTKTLTGISRAINARKFDDVPAQLARWVYDNGRKLPGLVKRRAEAGRLWREGFEEARA